MRMDKQDLIELISRYLDNALSAEENVRMLEIIRTDQAAADLLCELCIQHVQLHRLFKKDGATLTRRDLSAAPVFSRFMPVWRPLALAACLVIIIAAGFWLTGFLRDRDARSSVSIVLLKVGQDIEDAARAENASVGTTVVVPPGTIQLLRFKDGTIFELEAGSKAQIINTGSAASGKTIKLMAGTVIAAVTRQPADFPLRLITPHVEVIVVGTRFTCKVEEDHSHVRMHHGWAHVVSAINSTKVKLESRHHVTAGKMFHFRIRSIHEDEH